MHRYSDMKQELEHVYKSGVDLYLDGTRSSPDVIAYRCIREDKIYMADYIWDEGGNLKELRYDRISKM